MAVGVEIEQANSTGHFHAMREVQYVSYHDPNQLNEVTRITVDNVQAGGTYIINFKSPATNKYV